MVEWPYSSPMYRGADHSKTMPIDLYQSWTNAWLRVGATDVARDQCDNLLERYSEPHRAYHTLQHLHECLEHLARCGNEIPHRTEVELALWFHDAIYDVHAADNEEQSAELATMVMTDGNINLPSVELVHSLILATKHTAAPSMSEAMLLVDIDLAILGANAERYAEYERQIRAEYDFVPEAAFRSKRAEILRMFLSRPKIYSTPEFAARFEEPARQNISRELKRLEA